MLKRALAVLLLSGVIAAKPVKYTVTEATLKSNQYAYWTALEPVYWTVIEKDVASWKAAGKRFTPEQMQLLACYDLVVAPPNPLGDTLIDYAPHLWVDGIAGLKQVQRDDLAGLLTEAVAIRNKFPAELPDNNERVSARILFIEVNKKWQESLIKRPIEPFLDGLIRKAPKQFRFQGTVENPKAE